MFREQGGKEVNSVILYLRDIRRLDLDLSRSRRFILRVYLHFYFINPGLQPGDQFKVYEHHLGVVGHEAIESDLVDVIL